MRQAGWNYASKWFYGIAVFAALVASVGTITIVTIFENADSNLPDLRAELMCVSLVGMSVISYVAWPSRWNVVAHAQVTFSIVAYVIPIIFLDRLVSLRGDGVELYYKVCALGFVSMFAGVLIGRALVSPTSGVRLAARARFDDLSTHRLISGRVFAIALMSVAGILVSFAVMGFVPAFAADPFAAKFFRGPYAAGYAPVAPIYRASTTAIALILPLIGLFAWKIRTPAWVVLFVGALGSMLLGLMRDPAMSGALLLIGVAVALRGRGLKWYFALLVGVYFVGGGFYFLLTKLGVPGFKQDGVGDGTFLGEVAAGAPDVSDQVNFLRAWIQRPEYTDGMTFIGGLVPGNFEWNPSVWSLGVVNPGVPISQISSGGLRLPAPIWGLVSFGWPGVIIVSALSGLLIGYLAKLASKLVPSTSMLKSTYWLLLYVAAIEVFPVFYRLSYLSVLQLGIIVALLFWGTNRQPRVVDHPRRETAAHRRLAVLADA